jgi:CRISPR-associated protein Csm5
LLDERRFASPAWLTGMRQLLGALRPALDRGDAALLRVGRHSGAENVTLDGVRDIRIMQGRGMPARQGDESTTLWLAAERENVTRGDLLPFGWVLIEREGAADNDDLRRWCAAQPKPDMAAVRARLAQARAQADAEAADAAAQQAARLAAIDAEHRAQQEAAARRARLSPQQQDVDALGEALRARVAVTRGVKDKPHTELHARARALAKRALAEAWSADDRHALADMLEQCLPVAVSIDWKDERKKLGMAQLRE